MNVTVPALPAFLVLVVLMCVPLWIAIHELADTMRDRARRRYERRLRDLQR